jgi:2-dehydropantoate 2-reductase
MRGVQVHICIIGPGSVGLFLAAHLAQHEQVTITARSITVTAKQGVRVVGLLACQAEVDTSPGLVEADLVVVTTKAMHLNSVIPLLKNCKSPVVFFQNGLGINQLAKTQLPGVPLIRALSWMGVVRETPYTVRCNGFSHITIGSLQGDTNLRALLASLEQAGLSTEIVDNINTIEWEKAMLNIAVNGLCAITGERNGVVIDSPHLHEVFVQLIRETQTVASATGYNLDLEESIVRLTRTTATNINSMLQDIQAGRLTEIDYLNGYVMHLGNQLGISTPYNTTVYHLVKHIEARRSHKIS